MGKRVFRVYGREGGNCRCAGYMDAGSSGHEKNAPRFAGAKRGALKRGDFWRLILTLKRTGSDDAPRPRAAAYGACLVEYDRGETVKEIPYIFDVFGESPVTLPDIKKRLEDAQTADEAQEILEAVRLTSFGSSDDVNCDGMTEIFRYSTDDGPVAYWIRSDSAEKELENGSGISVYAIDKKSDYIAVDYNRAEKRVMYHSRHNGKTYSCNYKPESTDVLYISALFSAIAKMFVSSAKDVSMANLNCEFNELMENFDYSAYMSTAGDIILPGNIPAADG